MKRNPFFFGVFFIFFLGINGLFLMRCSLKVEAVSLEANGVEKKVKPGNELILSVVVSNDENRPVEVVLEPVNMTMVGNKGEQRFLPIGSGGDYEFAKWVVLENKKIRLKANQKKEIVYRVEVPENASPGGHYGAILVIEKNLAFPGEKDTVRARLAINGGLAHLVFLQVGGEVEEKLDVGLKFLRKRVYSEFPINYDLSFENQGTVYLEPVGNIYLKNRSGETIDVINLNPEFKIIFPKNTRKWLISRTLSEGVKESKKSGFWRQAYNEFLDFHCGRYQILYKVAYGKGQGKGLVQATNIWIIPWQLLTIVFILFCLIVAVVFVLKYLFFRDRPRVKLN